MCGGGGRPWGWGGGGGSSLPFSQPPSPPSLAGASEEAEGLWQGRWQGPPQPSSSSSLGTNALGPVEPTSLGHACFCICICRDEDHAPPPFLWEQPSPGPASTCEPGLEPHTPARAAPLTIGTDNQERRGRGTYGAPVLSSKPGVRPPDGL